MKVVFNLKVDNYNRLPLFDEALMKPLVASLFFVLITMLHQSLIMRVATSNRHSHGRTNE
ncbi:hypothetical protein RhiirA1_458359 [Rhizophagus irregularis]|uniref:Uncharacterized protein n=1 Tax=Rhizophagus irregularis TaxID=588596 RepID=A0A2N0RW43_9GLOM|nr:hypothetical protein RhiirA1_458359 [Rhizophagus irregularis]